jgi:hypothetical protein
VRTPAPTHAVISGSLGTGNLGDAALLHSFRSRHGCDYDAVSVIANGPAVDVDPETQVLGFPQFALGHRFWYGRQDRRDTRRRIADRAPGAERDYIWLGGLLGGAEMHNRLRERELRWARRFSRRVIYYFGDVADGFPATTSARRLVRVLDRSNAWIGVRSSEAAELLAEAGLGGQVHTGVDPVLYDRATRHGLPFRRLEPAVETLAIVPCAYRPELAPVWLAAARAGAHHGLTPRWVSFSDGEDLALCRELAERSGAELPGLVQDVVPSELAELRLMEAACCVATRYHAAIFAITAGVPTLGVPYDVKVSRLMRLLGLDEFIVDLSSLTSDPASDLWDEHIDRQLHRALHQPWSPHLAELEQRLTEHERALQDLATVRGAP